MKVSELDSTHLGEEIMVESTYWYIGGVLHSVHHQNVFVEERTLSAPQFTRIPVGIVTTLVIGGWERTVDSSESVGVAFL